MGVASSKPKLDHRIETHGIGHLHYLSQVLHSQRIHGAGICTPTLTPVCN